jgi:hypothetical protein
MPESGLLDNRTLSEAETFGDVVSIFVSLINAAIPALLALMLLFIIWKAIDMWVINAGDEQKVTEGKQLIITSVIVMVVISSLWGLVALLRNSFFM